MADARCTTSRLVLRLALGEAVAAAASVPLALPLFLAFVRRSDGALSNSFFASARCTIHTASRNTARAKWVGQQGSRATSTPGCAAGARACAVHAMVAGHPNDSAVRTRAHVRSGTQPHAGHAPFRLW